MCIRDREKCVCQGGKQELSAEKGMITNAGFYRKILTSRATESTTNASATTDTDGVVCSTCPVGADCAGAGNRADTISALVVIAVVVLVRAQRLYSERRKKKPRQVSLGK